MIALGMAMLAMLQAEAPATERSAQAAVDAWAACLGERVFEQAVTTALSDDAITEGAIEHCAPQQQAMLAEHERWLAAAAIDPERAERARGALRASVEEIGEDLEETVRDIRRGER
ncbi:MAG: hypothetical protein H7X93_13205 [Sphingomonadaceae bacterium]|nr:hypothetical protein [Sphingomonadaceae bacterium]